MAMDRRKYPRGWRRISNRYRFEVAGGICEQCGVTHGKVYPKGPDLKCEYPATRIVIVFLNAAHRYHNTESSTDEDLICLCPRCHARYDMDDILAKKEYGMEHAGPQQLKLFEF